MKIDEQVFKDTKVFSYIPEMNKGDVDMKDVFKYKTKELNSPRIYRDTPKKINKYFWEFNLLGLNEKCKFRHGKANIHYPILIEDFMKLYFNIKNPYIYNTDRDVSFEKYRTLNRQFRNNCMLIDRGYEVNHRDYLYEYCLKEKNLSGKHILDFGFNNGNLLRSIPDDVSFTYTV